ncbi:hypothetical protein B7P43_G02851 [Cryptotermes secundus]|uniref:Uncharacterized protein n=1 Tax=Cryptotermes secundus TaxID=105785 RepID=A0A2J7RIL7_9NEOP|nr:hypothetical protein B7P43_G02851 [Cryptotermes secundus]
MTSGMIAALSSNSTRVISCHNLNKIGFVLIQACMYEPRSYQFNMAQRRKQLRSLGGQEILDMFSDELSDLPTALSSYSEAIISNSDSDGDHRAA